MIAEKLIIDCDPGQDDAVMLFLALAAPELFDILGITTVAGNVPLIKTQRNARIICDIAQRPDIKVFAGCKKPLKRKLITAEKIHGIEGIDGAPVYEPNHVLEDDHAVDFIINTLKNAKENEITLVPTGPLTNIALALSKEPSIKKNIKQIVLMGGSMREGGNVTPSAEFNIYVDPDAAEIVFSCCKPIIVIPLDVTHKVITNKERIKNFESINNSSSQIIYNILNYHNIHDKNKYSNIGGPLHDPCTIAYLIDPSNFVGKKVNLSVETKSLLTLGETVVDFWNITKKQKNIFWIYDVDANKVFSLIYKYIARLP